MNPKINSQTSINHDFKEISNSPKSTPDLKNPLAKQRMSAKTQIMDKVENDSTKNIKSEVASKSFSGKPVNKPPPPKYPAPPPPSGFAAISSHFSTSPSVFSSAAELGNPPSRPETPPPDFPPDAALMKSVLNSTPQPSVVSSTTKTDNLSHPVIDTTVYPHDTPSITITGDQKIPFRETSKISKKDLAAAKLEFNESHQRDFCSLVLMNQDVIDLMDSCQLTEKEVAAIHAYTKDEYYVAINNQFRHLPLHKVDISDPKALINAGVQNSDLAELIAALITGMRKLPPVQTSGEVIHPLGRNVTMFQDELNSYVQDAEIIQSTFLSTTNSAASMVSGPVGFWNAKEVGLIIYPRVNGNARDITPFSQYPDEREILFMPNTKFKVMFRNESLETYSGASKKEVAALEALHLQEKYEELKTKAKQNDEEGEEARKELQKKEYSNTALFKPGAASKTKNDEFRKAGTVTKTFISISEIPL